MKPLLHLLYKYSSFTQNNYDVIELAKNHKWDELNSISICTDKHGIVRAFFGQNLWDCSPFAADKGSDRNQREFDFTYLTGYPELLLQSKLIVYGWLFEQGHSFGKHCKLSTLTSRFNIGLKKTLISLMQNGTGDLTALNNPKTWHKLEESLKDLNTSKRTLELAFTALQAVSRLNYWLPFQLELPNKSYKQLARKLANKDKSEHMQALAIPQALANKLYGEAVKEVEQAWPHREKLAQFE